MRYSKKEIAYLLISILFAALLSFLIYNIRVILVYLLDVHIGPFKQPNLAKFICYFFFAYLLRFKTISFSRKFWMLFLPVFLIDATTLLFGPELIPLRFPYVTIYPLLGIYCGLLLRTNRVKFIFVFASSVVFMLLSHFFFIPSIIWYMHKSYDVSVNTKKTISNDTFLGINNTTIRLFDTLKNKPALIEFYFVGCAPCEDKYKYLKNIHDEFGNKGLQIVLICDGIASSYDRFAEHWELNKYKNIIFLYDERRAINQYNIDGYPTEFLIRGTKILKREKGFGKTIADKWMNKERVSIENILENGNEKAQ